jgi:hypothetical protein
MKGSEGIFSLLTAMLGIAMVAVIVQSPNTSRVISAGGTAFSGSVRAVMGR